MDTELYEPMTIICNSCGEEMEWKISGDYLVFSCEACEITEELLLDDLSYNPLVDSE